LGRQLGPIAGLVDGRLDPPAGLGAHVRIAVDDVGDGLHRDAGEIRDVAQAGRASATRLGGHGGILSSPEPCPARRADRRWCLTASDGHGWVVYNVATVPIRRHPAALRSPMPLKGSCSMPRPVTLTLNPAFRVAPVDRKSTRLNSSHVSSSYDV